MRNNIIFICNPNMYNVEERKMLKKEKKQKSFVIEINQEVADMLGIAKKSDIEMILMDDMLVIKSKKKKAATVKKKALTKSNALTKKLMSEYEEVLTKLAKT